MNRYWICLDIFFLISRTHFLSFRREYDHIKYTLPWFTIQVFPCRCSLLFLLFHWIRGKFALKKKKKSNLSNSNPPPTLPPLCCHRRGNWITLKLKKLIKSGSREHGVDQLHVHEPSGQDGGSFLSSDGLGGSAGHALSPPQRHSSECQPLSVESQRSSSPAFHSSNHIPGSEVTVGHDSNFPCCAESTATCVSCRSINSPEM